MQVPPKHWQMPARLHGLTSQKTVIFMFGNRMLRKIFGQKRENDRKM
jgi:hypothetical protein